jgi:hypothetical protein
VPRPVAHCTSVCECDKAFGQGINVNDVARQCKTAVLMI